jgi:beta-glucosidase
MQVEGGNTNNDWYEWAVQGHTHDLPGVTCDEDNRYDQDFAMAQAMNHNAHRLSIEWSKIEPQQGVFSREAIDHYRAVLSAARARGLKTFVTLHHFTNPLWASHQGGWTNDQMPKWFANYTAYAAVSLGDLVDYWMTINEPNVMVLTGYTVGLSPPGKTDVNEGIHALVNMMKGHAAAYHVIHDLNADAKVGFAHHMRVFEGARWWNPLDSLVASFVTEFWNKQILNAMKTGRIYFAIPFLFGHDERWPALEGTLDFVGVNYYTRDFIQLDFNAPQKFTIVPNEPAPKSDLGWEIYPEGMYKTVMTAASYGWPVYITENGIADAEDTQRGKYICDHLKQLAYAMDDGADVRGYLHWSLIDNWEWVDGFVPRFGLAAMDYRTQARTPRGSAKLLADIIAKRSLEDCK